MKAREDLSGLRLAAGLLLCSLVASTVLISPAAAQARTGRILGQYSPDPGLRVEPNAPLKVEVDLVQTNEIGLTERGIRQMCAARLIEAGIPVMPDSSTAQTNTLYFNVNVSQDSVAITMAFAKLVVTAIGSEKFLRRTTTWTDSIVGEHRNSLDIVQPGLLNAFDHFVSEYLRANGAQAQIGE
jgi:hypothetical protein